MQPGRTRRVSGDRWRRSKNSRNKKFSQSLRREFRCDRSLRTGARRWRQSRVTNLTDSGLLPFLTISAMTSSDRRSLREWAFKLANNTL